MLTNQPDTLCERCHKRPPAPEHRTLCVCCEDFLAQLRADAEMDKYHDRLERKREREYEDTGWREDDEEA